MACVPRLTTILQWARRAAVLQVAGRGPGMQSADLDPGPHIRIAETRVTVTDAEIVQWALI